MTITCIIPFFNERDRILKVLDEVVKIKDVNQILVVDDGSTDGTTEQVKQRYSNIAILHNKKNLGKTEAITTGLKHAKGEYIFLLDADLQGLNHQELEKNLDVIRKDDLLLALDLYKPCGYELEFALNQYMMDKQNKFTGCQSLLQTRDQQESLDMTKGCKK